MLRFLALQTAGRMLCRRLLVLFLGDMQDLQCELEAGDGRDG